MTSVTIDKVGKLYGAVRAIDSVSIDIQAGQFVVLVGPSGCGKSTLLRMIAGLEHISEGTIGIAGQVVNDRPPKDRDIAMVFQNYALYPHMTVADNMGFSLKLKGVSKPERDAKVKAAAGILGLEALLPRYPRQLSGGQRQRVAMGRAIVRNPKVFLFDEPLSNLDAKLRVQMRTEIKALHQRIGTTIVYVTHDQIEAMTMADTIVVMRDGRVEQAGPPLELYDRPTNLFVAGFIGSPAMNIFPGIVSDAGLRLEDGSVLPLPRTAVPIGSAVSLGIRPEHLQVAPEGFAAAVELLEPTGSETQILARVDGRQIVSLARERVSARPGDTVRFTYDPKLTHLFDRSGVRLG